MWYFKLNPFRGVRYGKFLNDFLLPYLMLTKGERQKKFSLTEHTMLMFYERGIKERLFPHCLKSREVWEEFTRAFVDEKKSVIIPDNRQASDSSHMCIFINESNKPVAVPIKVTDNHVHVFTLKDVQKDENPRWYIDSYNSIAKGRDMQLIPPQSI